jgi:hypothetical protein
MRNIAWILLLIGLAIGLTGRALACSTCGCSSSKSSEAKKVNVKTLQPQTTCPVMGGKINKKYYIDVKGYRIYVCCPGCINKIKSDPDKYIQKLHKLGVRIEKAPVSKKK